MTVVSGFRPLTIVAEVSVLYCAGVLGPPRSWIQCFDVVWGGNICGDDWRLAAVDCCRGVSILCGAEVLDPTIFIMSFYLYCIVTYHIIVLCYCGL